LPHGTVLAVSVAAENRSEASHTLNREISEKDRQEAVYTERDSKIGFGRAGILAF
jgi:hypothetical protein